MKRRVSVFLDNNMGIKPNPEKIQAILNITPS